MTKKTKRIIKIRITTILAYITYAIMMLAVAGLVYLALDFLGLVGWAVSGQVPEGGFNTGFYLGKAWYLILVP